MQTNRNFERSPRDRNSYEEDCEYTPRATVSGRRRSRKMIQHNVCPDCGAKLTRTHGHYFCPECPGVSIGRALGV